VRFDLTPSVLEPPREYQSSFHNYNDDDTPSDDDDDDDRHSTASGQARRPLLTDIEAPSITLANRTAGDDVHDWAEEERRRPKSGLQSAFMNMANSIIGAGIIGQPYAMRQAGLLTGLTLLVGLTIVVDWTIRLIVLNSKLSGTGSFQSTVQHCFGKPGLIAISLAQWLFAFGGQVGFGIIIGDSMPHVFRAVWPGLEEMPVMRLLANRRVVIVIFVLGISFPLTLYRDVAKVGSPYPLSLPPPPSPAPSAPSLPVRVYGDAY
jgi:sodium-coupled neutral amino acid transporter 11